MPEVCGLHFGLVYSHQEEDRWGALLVSIKAVVLGLSSRGEFRVMGSGFKGLAVLLGFRA